MIPLSANFHTSLLFALQFPLTITRTRKIHRKQCQQLPHPQWRSDAYRNRCSRTSTSRTARWKRACVPAGWRRGASRTLLSTCCAAATSASPLSTHSISIGYQMFNLTTLTLLENHIVQKLACTYTTLIVLTAILNILVNYSLSKGHLPA